MPHPFTNRLINETSPYLLQHAHNPVDWFAWGEEAMEKAKTENKVILVSIGYSACHWCHVMEKESFEDEKVAILMNKYFINIKIDREERPDLDHIYMDAVQAISGSGGWPLNVFLTPDAKPFYGGTYYPPVNLSNRPSWTDVLENIFASWKDKQNEIESQAENLLAHIGQSNTASNKDFSSIINQPEAEFTTSHCDSMFFSLMKNADIVWGGFGKAPKFPQTFILQYLLQYYYFSNNQQALTQALLSIDKILQGGIYDHVGGGMARYSTDVEWLVPHFEKMLYDNALLIEVLCDVWQITKNEKYKAAIYKTILFVQQELTAFDGGFFSALDADSEGIEGKFYVWQKQDIDAILKEDSILFCEFFDVSDNGNWEECNILRILRPVEEFLIGRNLSEIDFNILINNSLQKLFTVRANRIRPQLDDKIILSWNALMIKSIAKAAIVLDDDGLAEFAEKAFTFIQAHFKKEADSIELMHTYKNNIAKYPAFLDDYAYLIAACLQLYEINFDMEYLERANIIAEFVIENFSDDINIFFFFTHKHQKDVVIRKKEIYDGAIPSGNSIMASNLTKLSIIFNKPKWHQRATLMLSSLSESITKYPGSFAIWASLLQQHVFGINEIAVTGSSNNNLVKEICNNFIPNKILMVATKGSYSYPMLIGKPETSEPLIYLCKNYQCLTPCKTVAEFLSYVTKSTN